MEKSVEEYVRNQLYVVRSYPQDRVVFLDAYPDDARMRTPLTVNSIAIGWAADDGGRQAELGSSLKRRLFTFDYYIFALSRVWGRNLASVIRSSVEADGNIDLLDPATGAVIDSVAVDYASAQQVTKPNPRPWEQNAWAVRVRVEDYYSSAMGG